MSKLYPHRRGNAMNLDLSATGSEAFNIRMPKTFMIGLRRIALTRSLKQGTKVTYPDLIREALLAHFPELSEGLPGEGEGETETE